MKQISVVKAVLKLAPLALAVSCSLSLLSGCSSSSDSAPTGATISGTIVAAPVNSADVSVIDANGNVVAGPVQTNATGQYTLSIPNASLTQDLIVKSTGGTFTDEATGNPGAAGEMYAYASANSLSNGSSVSATPGSAIIASLVMDHGKTMDQAKAAFATAFGYTPDTSVTPADATTAPAADETDAETLAGFRAGAFSQLAMDLGLSQNDQFALFAALAQDLSDDKLDGVDASGAVAIGTTGKTLEADIQNDFSMALVNFNNSDYNLTGLDNNEFGDIPFAKVALTTSYQVEYKQLAMMGPVNGKDTFQIRVSDRNDTATGVAGLTNMLMPMMYMLGTHKHSTPMPAPAINDDGNGLYTVTLYYLMPTAMGGYWDLKFMIDGEETHFYPEVMMAMGDTVQARLKGVVDPALMTDSDGDGNPDIASLNGIADIISNMMGVFTNRAYMIFRDDLVDNGTDYTFTMFLSASGDMMDFPQLQSPSTLKSGMAGTPLDITSIDVRVGVNGGVLVSANPLGDGKWEITGLALDDGPGVANQLEVELSVNGETKTADGAPGGANAMLTVTPTPSMM